MKHPDNINILFLFVLVMVFFSGFSARGNCRETAQGQLVITANMLWDYAHTLMDKKDYATAEVELKRFVYFFPEDPRINGAKLAAGQCLFHREQYLEAARICNQIMLDIPLSHTGEEACFLQSLCFEKMGNIPYATLVLHNYLKLIDIPEETSKARDPQNRKLKDRILFHLGRLCLVQGTNTASLKQIEKAEDFFVQISFSGIQKYNVDTYRKTIAQAKAFPLKKPAVGAALAIVPGAGFLYTHRFHDALATLVVNAGLAMAACKAWEQDNRALAGVLALLESGFYAGNIYGSMSAVHKYNRRGMVDLVTSKVFLSPVLGREQYGVMLEMPFSLLKK